MTGTDGARGSRGSEPMLQIDRLTLRADAMTPEQGRRLAELVGQGLLGLSGYEGIEPTRAPDLSVTATAAATPEATARAVVAAIEALLRAGGAD